MKRRLAFILLTAFVSVFSTVACGGGEGEEQQGGGQHSRKS